MKILKSIFITLVAIVIIALVAALFLRKEYSVEREVVINKPKSEVYDYIKYLKNQDNFSVWASMDPNMKKWYKGADGTEGFVAYWESDNKDVGKGEQEIKKITPGERVDYELRFIEPFESSSDAYMTTEAVGDDQTKVKWGFKGKMDYPMNLMLAFMDMEDMIGNDFDKGLNNLKSNLEK